MTSYTDIFNHYREHFYCRVEQEYSWYKQPGNLRDAVERAFLSINEKGEIEDHQSRYGIPKCLPLAAEIALEHLDTQCIIDFDNFNSIYQFVRSVRKKVKGFGELANYDVAMRIAHYQGCGELQVVYLHAGVKTGFRALGLNEKNRRIIPIEEFPEPFNQLSGDHLENLLCLYKKMLDGSSVEFPKTCIRPKRNSSSINKNGRVC
ncbi:hypothetical protein [Nostoc sphaeroides]|uniref:Uncharacterized protein n=1 Tax=Nostoc sphaeroides CCNUC1 TaxID=2653204 RepID=A0A5P8W925_9NOSO|nr:hypothetical protein [Nostoc sphaeroides]QFS49062.1 hypothetical protein GXM_06556 [Nostoc sphaeroides CCNUC1]